MKPVALVKDALLDCSNRGGIVLDPFGGSGTTMIAAECTGRRARLIEDPLLFIAISSFGAGKYFRGKSRGSLTPTRHSTKSAPVAQRKLA